jgi:glucan phosphoethanolaminetransferase (alkaline phosphatase superfamily)
MSWGTVFRLRQWARGSLWLLPLAGGLLGVLLGWGIVLSDQSVHLPSFWTYSASTASTVLSAIVGAMAA